MVDIISIGITILIIIGIGLFFYTLLRLTPEEAWTTALMTIMSLIFLVGLFGNTKIALFPLYGMSVVGILVGLYRLVRKQQYSVVSFFSPGIVMVLLLTVFVTVAFHGFHITNWDELFQWGKAANYLVEYDRFPKTSEMVGSELLLSTTTFFHYFVAKLGAWITGNPIESEYYVSNVLLWMSAVILPLSGMVWKDWKRVFSFGLFQFLFVTIIFVQPFYNIYTDQPTAYWAGGLIGWLLLKKDNRKNTFIIPLILVNVGMMKSMVGPLFAGIVVLTLVINYYSECKENRQKVIPENWKKKLFSKRTLFYIVTIVSTVLYTVIWSVVIKRNGVYRGSSILSDVEANRFRKTIKAMVRKLFVPLNGQEGILNLSFLSFLVFCCIIVYVLYPVVLDKQIQKRFYNLFCVYIAGFGGYFLIMVFAYLKIFGYNDSVNAISLERYFSDYVMLGIVPLCIPVFLRLQKEEQVQTKILKRFVILTLFMYIILSTNGYILPRMAHIYAVDTELYAEREKMIKYTRQIKEITNGEGKIYFVNQSKTGLYTLVADYELGEQLSREGMCFNFRKDTTNPVNGLTEYGIDTLPDVLVEEDYDYLWVYTTNDYFNKKMNEIFGIDDVKNGKLYRVRNIENNVILEYIAMIK